jgi:hypothetical protein
MPAEISWSDIALRLLLTLLAGTLIGIDRGELYRKVNSGEANKPQKHETFSFG